MKKMSKILPLFISIIGFVLCACSNDLPENDSNNSSPVDIDVNENTEPVSLKECLVTYILNGGTLPEGTDSSFTVEENTHIQPPTPIRDGYSFQGWFYDEELTFQFSGESLITSDVVLYASWTEITYSITYLLNGGVNNADNPTGYSITSQKITLLEPTKENAMFLGWTNDEMVVPTKNVEINTGSKGDLTFKANWYESSRINNNDNIPIPQNGDSYARYWMFEIRENNIFVIAFYTVYSSGYTIITVECGLAKYEDNGVIRLIFSNKEYQDRFVKAEGSHYVFTDENGRPLSQVGNDEVTIVFDNVIEPYKEARYGYQWMNAFENASAMQTIYNKIWEVCDNFHNVDKDLEDLTLLTVSFDYYGVTVDEFLKVFKMFVLDHPEYYFLSQGVMCSEYVGTLSVDKDYAKNTYRKKIDADIDIMINDCALVLNDNQNDLEKYLAIHDYVNSLIDYAYDENGVPSDESWAHSIVGTAEKLGGVCEAYAETFDLLCHYYGLVDIQVTGATKSGENHVWNLIKLDDLYYSVDCTWDDGNDGAPHQYFGLSYANTNSTKIAESSTNVGISYLYDLPKMSDESVQLIYLNRGETSLGTYKSIDDALMMITEPEFEYSLELYLYDLIRGLTNKPSTTYVSKIQDYPEAKKISFVGRIYDLGLFQSTISHLQLDSDITFHSDMDFSNLIIDGDGKMSFGNYTLSFSGLYGCDTYVPIYSPQGRILIDCSEDVSYKSDTTFYNNLTIETFDLIGGGVTFRAGVANINTLNSIRVGRRATAIHVLPYVYITKFGFALNINKFVLTTGLTQLRVGMFGDPDNEVYYFNGQAGEDCYKYIVNIGTIKDESEEDAVYDYGTSSGIDLVINQTFNLDNYMSDITINGNIDPTIQFEYTLNPLKIISVNPNDGSVTNERTRYAELDDGFVLLVAPYLLEENISLTSLTNQQGTIYKDSDGNFRFKIQD